jgi:predicted enzyme related to lactoylglutathione lyase
MSNTDYSVGSTVWQELQVKSAVGIDEFYRAVLGWSLDRKGTVGKFYCPEGHVVGGLQVNPDFADDETGWLCYLGTDDLQATLLRATGAGAEIIAEGKALTVEGEAVELRDPFGARFGIARLPLGVATVQNGDLGHLSLVDPTNHSLADEVSFQQALFPEDVLESLDGGINFFRNKEGTALRGAYEIHEELRPFIPPHWLPWFNVASQADAISAAAAHGGHVNTQDNDLSFGIWGVVVDPAGAEFKTLQLKRSVL